MKNRKVKLIILICLVLVFLTLAVLQVNTNNYTIFALGIVLTANAMELIRTIQSDT